MRNSTAFKGAMLFSIPILFFSVNVKGNPESVYRVIPNNPSPISSLSPHQVYNSHGETIYRIDDINTDAESYGREEGITENLPPDTNPQTIAITKQFPKKTYTLIILSDGSGEVQKKVIPHGKVVKTFPKGYFKCAKTKTC